MVAEQRIDILYSRRKDERILKKILTNLLLLLLLLLLSVPTLAPASMAHDAVEIMFSQEIVALDPAGTPYQSTIIDPLTMSGMTSYDFDLQRGRRLRVVSNLPMEQNHELAQVAQIVKNSYDFIEKMTGGTLEKGVLLYLLEFERLPLSYRFEATYRADAPWQEVRVVLLNRGEALLGTTGSAELAELLYDTLPHELGHDVLANITTLLHDIDGAPSHHTRWFIEGVCEVLAKQFARGHAPDAGSRFLAMRNVAAVLSNSSVRNELFNWAQQNDNGMALESDLYGAAMLTLMAWTENVALPRLLARINQCSTPQCGVDLEQLLEATTGLSRQGVMERASLIGEQVSQANSLAMSMH